MNRLIIRAFYLILTVITVFACNNPQTCDIEPIIEVVDLEEIIERDTLVVVISTNSTDYFVYRGQPMGFHFELTKLFADNLGIELRVIVENDIGKSIELIKSNKADILAQGMTITNLRRTKMSFTVPIAKTHQVLVQQISDTMIGSTLDLANKTIYVQKGTVFTQRLKHLSEEIAAPIHVVEIDSLEVEQIIAKVSEGVFGYTVCDESVATMNQRYYTNIDVSLEISLEQYIAWAVRKSSHSLLDTLNHWLLDYTKTVKFTHLYNKYYKHPGLFRNVSSDYYSGSKGQISDYDEWIKQYSKEIGWDWRLLASLIYQESRFNPNAVSWAGASGIMQIMPATADMLGLAPDACVEAQIYAGVRLIKMIDNRVPFEITDTITRQKYILAGYNIGYGHVEDAIRLAEKHGADPNKWEDNVAEYLIHKSNYEYFTDSVVKFGYCPGIQPVSYVKEIFDRFEHYKNVIPE
jgi:membrane-bound lytic murein transglycosylase F